MLNITPGKLYRIDGEFIADHWYLTTEQNNDILSGKICRNSIFLLLDVFYSDDEYFYDIPFYTIKILTEDGIVGWTNVKASCIHGVI